MWAYVNKIFIVQIRALFLHVIEKIEAQNLPWVQFHTQAMLNKQLIKKFFPKEKYF